MGLTTGRRVEGRINIHALLPLLKQYLDSTIIESLLNQQDQRIASVGSPTTALNNFLKQGFSVHVID